MPPLGIGSCVGRPPVSGTVNNWPNQELNVVRRDRNTMFLLSGVQVTTMLSGPQRSGASGTTSEWKVRRLASPPDAGITYTSVLPRYWPVKAIHFPSGEKRGMMSKPGSVVSRWAVPPARFTSQRLPCASNTTLSPWSVGKRISVLLACAALAPNANSSKAGNSRTERGKQLRNMRVFLLVRTGERGKYDTPGGHGFHAASEMPQARLCRSGLGRNFQTVQGVVIGNSPGAGALAWVRRGSRR